MKELVSHCIRCSKEVFCTDGFLNGHVLDNQNVLCFDCQADDKLVGLLNQLLEAEKAGVETMDYLLNTYPDVELAAFMKLIKQDEAWSVNGLIQSVRREGGMPSKETGDFTEKVKAKETFAQKIGLLIKGQAWVARKIDDALAYGMDEQTKTFLLEMKRRHLDNIAAVEQA